MEENLVTLAIHTYEKAQILKSVLEVHGIDVCMELTYTYTASTNSCQLV